MTDSTNDLYFSNYNNGKVVGKHGSGSAGNGLKNKELKKVIIPSFYLGVKVTEIGYQSFDATNIVSVFLDMLKLFHLMHLVAAKI